MLVVGDVRTADEISVQVATGPVRAETAVAHDGAPVADPDLVRTMNAMSAAPARSRAVVLSYPADASTLVAQVSGLITTRSAQAAPLPRVVELVGRDRDQRTETLARSAKQMFDATGNTLLSSSVRVASVDPGAKATLPQANLRNDPMGAILTAVEWTGLRGIGQMLLPADADLDAVRAWAVTNDAIWRSLPPYIHDLLFEHYPHVLAEAPGLPTSVSDIAGQLVLVEQSLSRRTDVADDQAAAHGNIHRLVLQAGARGLPVQRLDHRVDGEVQELTVAIGDLDHARRVHWMVVEDRDLAVAMDLDDVFAEVDDGETAIVVVARGVVGSLVPVAQRAQSDGIVLTRRLVAYNAVRRAQDPYGRRPENHVGDSVLHSDISLDLDPDTGVGAEIDSMTVRNDQSWFANPDREIRHMLAELHRSRAELRTAVAALAVELRIDEALGELDPADLAFDRLLVTLQRLSDQAGGAVDQATLLGLFERATRLAEVNARILGLERHLAGERGPDHWNRSQPVAARELVSVYTRRQARAAALLEAVEDLAQRVSRENPSRVRALPLRYRLDLPLHLDDADPQRISYLLSIIAADVVGRPNAERVLARITELVQLLPQLAVMDAEIAFLQRQANLPAVTTLTDALDRTLRELHNAQRDLAEFGEPDQLAQPRALRWARTERGRLFRELAGEFTARFRGTSAEMTSAEMTSAEMASAEMTVAAIMARVELLPPTDSLRRTAERYLAQYRRTAAVENFAQIDSRYRWLLAQAQALGTHARDGDDVRVQAVLDDVTVRFEAVPATTVPETAATGGDSRAASQTPDLRARCTTSVRRWSTTWWRSGSGAASCRRDGRGSPWHRGWPGRCSPTSPTSPMPTGRSCPHPWKPLSGR